MLYKSTRGGPSSIPFSEILLGGLAPDGGLFIPEKFPKFSKEEIEAKDNQLTVGEHHISINKQTITNVPNSTFQEPSRLIPIIIKFT